MVRQHPVRVTVVPFVALVAAGCGSGARSDALTGEGEAISRSTQALQVGALVAVDGTYGAGCVGRSGAWSLALGAGATLAHAPLTVVRDNADCTLQITHAVTTTETFALTPSVVLGEAYGSPSRAGSGAKTFYVNAKLQSASMASSLFVTVLYSDDPGTVSGGGVTAAYGEVSASGTATAVTAPDYTVDFAAGKLSVKVNAKKVVTSVTGSATLNQGAVPGSSWAITAESLGATPTLSAVEAAFDGASARGAIAGPSTTLDGASFGLSGVDLTSAAQRSILVKRTDAGGVPTYQVIRVTFEPPAAAASLPANRLAADRKAVGLLPAIARALGRRLQ